MKKTLLALATMAACTVVAVPAAHAVPIFLISPTPAGSGNFIFEYRAEFSTDEGVTAGSKLVIFDFAGYVPNSIFAPIGLDATTEFSSGMPFLPGYTDDPTILNLVFTYNGPPLDLSGLTFSGFGALSTYGTVTLDGFSDLTVKATDNGTLLAQQGATGVPLATAVPEPTSWALMIGGLSLVGLSLRRRPAKVSFA